jgi:hypothetical protein
VAKVLAISEDDACQILTGAATASEAKVMEGDYAAAHAIEVASVEASATEVAYSARSKMSAAQDMFVGRCDNAALTFETATAYAIAEAECKAAEGDKTTESCGRECARLRQAAHATCKAQTAAWKAALAARNALDAFCKAAHAAEAAHTAFRKGRDHTQKIAACNLGMEVRYKDSELVVLGAGVCAVDSAPMVGDIDRFFVRIISDHAAFASWTCGFVTCIGVNERDTIAEVKAKLQDREGILPEKIRLVYRLQRAEALQRGDFGIVRHRGRRR